MEYELRVEGDVLNIAQKIQEYDPNLKLKFLNPDYPSAISDAPWALFEVCKDGQERLVFYIWNLDDRVIHKLRQIDTQRSNVLELVSKENEKAKLEQQRRYQARKEQDIDLIKHVIANPKSSYSFKKDDKLVTIHEDKPADVKELA